MKKVIATLLACMALALVSCGKKPDDSVEPKPTKFYSSETYHAAIDMPSRVLLVQSGGLYYYSKVDGGSYRFCFNPLCQHTFEEKCPSYLFMMSSSMSGTVVYSEKLERVFFVRGQHIYSTSYDASDLKLEIALGPNGSIGNREYKQEYIRNLRSYGEYIYFMYKNDESGHEQIMRYNTKNGKCEEMTSGKNEWIYGYETADGYIYFKFIGNDGIIHYCTADMDLKNRVEIKDHIYPTSPGVSMGVFDGKRFYERAPEGLFAINPLTDEKELVSNAPELLTHAQIMAIKDNGIYFLTDETNTIGKRIDELTGVDTAVRVNNNKICRLSFDGKIETMLEAPGSILNFNFVDQNKAIVNFGTFYYDSGNGYLTGKPYVNLLFETNENGIFVSPRVIGRSEGDAELNRAISSMFKMDEPRSTTESTMFSTEDQTYNASSNQTAEPTFEPVTNPDLPLMGNYMILREQISFEELLMYPTSWQLSENEPYLCNSPQNLKKIMSANSGNNFIIVTIVGYSDETKDGKGAFEGMKYSYYYGTAQRIGDKTNDGTIYKIETFGTAQTPYYGFSRLEIGDKLLVLADSVNITTGIINTQNSCRLFEFNEELYVYPTTFVDISRFTCSERIFDEYEDLVYKPGLDDDIIFYIEHEKLPVPKYKYRCRLDKFIDEVINKKYMDADKIIPIGEYESIKKEVKFESFAELPEEMRTDSSLYILASKKDISDFARPGYAQDYVIAVIAGYIGEEFGDDGMVYSYYYVYAGFEEEFSLDDMNFVLRTYDDTVYIMKAYGSPAHPYYGQKRYEIGDIVLRLETDVEYIRNKEAVLSATSLLYIDSKTLPRYIALPDFDVDISSFGWSSRLFPTYDGQENVYRVGEDDDVITYIKKIGLDMPCYEYSYTDVLSLRSILSANE